MVNHFLIHYGTAAVIAEADEKIRYFKQGVLSLWDFSWILLDVTLREDVDCTEKMLRAFFAEDIDLSIHTAMWR